MDFVQALEQWQSNVEKATKLEISDQAKITNAGAKVFENALQKEVKSKHYRNHKTGNEIHLSESIIRKNTDIDGKKTGVSVVGFDSDHGYIARFLNDGTKYIHGDHFVENIRREVLNEVKQAEFAEYQRIVNSKKG